GDRERHDRIAAGDIRQPPLLLLVRTVSGDDRAADRRRDDHHEQRTSGGGELFEHEGQVVHATVPAAVARGQVHTEEAELSGLAPKLVQALALTHLPAHIIPPVAGAKVGDCAPQGPLLGRFDKAHQTSSSATTASSVPTSTCWPAPTGNSATTP